MPEKISKTAAAPAVPTAEIEAEVDYLARRHRVSPAVVREIIRSTGSHERSAIEREIRKGMMRR